ncbi:lipoprotein Spr [Cruoricaptor ignavus]|uniref:Lipoprotein Spr n=2 Tax=Cruoricaptor ignavus TaxID=1118202 RepID=A0A1M6DQZ2_9FLAO|nr:lipoprotein Spr [Cruoricaptor ignavus]
MLKDVKICSVKDHLPNLSGAYLYFCLADVNHKTFFNYRTKYMKKRVLIYLTAFFSALSLQSCVTNYVVSAPASPQSNTYKSDAKVTPIAAVDLTEPQKQYSPSKQIDAALANLEASRKKAEIEKAILHENKINSLIAEAESYLGTPYRYGGTTRSGIDCSAFVLSVFGAALGIDLPRVSSSQASQGERISRSELKVGDLVFFSHGGGRIGHVGIVHDVDESGEVRFIHAATSRGVMISALSDKYWGPRFVQARRVINDMLTESSGFVRN